ncbi:DUF2620 domain-containing protein [Parasphaerochaeta coccoides]|uniref:DUF2620 domain-containing protein n=1 Tax=Parasphaerochaeta coccoides (strain ATCC BAA-1237 / DSM 17374 / SPN1) TaxID=760011 RepID=F4GIV1_PARC1|nr:DUF2620 domain-containing protein [Parasphaerochaeta coccoides]AEC02719.1 hypothetical protein Spico_1516 [Parasphaerochaeta coccoides DSM 17374]
MKKIVVGGQMDKQEIAILARKIAGDRATVEIKSDIDAAMAIRTGAADIYLGACSTGGGGALALAIAILGLGSCCTVSMPGSIKSDEEIKKEVEAGKKAFGFTAQDIGKVVPIILSYAL